MEERDWILSGWGQRPESQDGSGAGDHDMAYRFGVYTRTVTLETLVGAHSAARLLILKSRIRKAQHVG